MNGIHTVTSKVCNIDIFTLHFFDCALHTDLSRRYPTKPLLLDMALRAPQPLIHMLKAYI